MPTVNAHRFAPAAPDENYVYGSCSPGWHSAAGQSAAIDDWIASMQRAGIERVCCLLPGRQLVESGANLDRYAAAFDEESILHAPVPDHHLLPETVLVEEILPFLADARTAEEPIVVQCLAGIGRTGQVLAAWLVYNHDYGPERAVATVQENGRDPTDAVRAGNATEADLIDLLSTVAHL